MKDATKHYMQSQKLSCGPAVMNMVLKKLGFAIQDEGKLIQLCGVNNRKGTTPDRFFTILNQLLGPLGYGCMYISGKDAVTELFSWGGPDGSRDTFYISLYMVQSCLNPHGSTSEPDQYGAHFALIDSIDLKKNTIILDNPFGFVEKFTLDEWKLRWGLDGSIMDFSHTLLYWIGVMRPYSLFKIYKLHS